MQIGRIITEHKTNYVLSSEGQEYLATVRGMFFTDKEFPRVGDFVAFEVVAEDKAVIENICPRKSVVSRKSAHTDQGQVIVANVNYIFIVMGLDGDFNLSRLERYLLLAKQSAVPAVVVLNKADEMEGVEEYIAQVQAVAQDVPVHAVSALTGENMEVVIPYFAHDATVVLLGSSGAGKSTITNWLMGADAQIVQGVRLDDSHGRHTTTTRQLFTLPTGGYLVDTPGMRELGLQEVTERDESELFALIDQLSHECRFSNCDHEKSKGCAVLEAIQAGEITQRQLASYHKLQRERLHEESKHDEALSFQYKQQKKKLYQSYGSIMERKRFERGIGSEVE